jgi:hypothetical protein
LPGGSARWSRRQAIADIEGMSGFRSLDWAQCVPFECLGRSDRTDGARRIRIIGQGEEAPRDSVA